MLYVVLWIPTTYLANDALCVAHTFQCSFLLPFFSFIVSWCVLLFSTFSALFIKYNFLVTSDCVTNFYYRGSRYNIFVFLMYDNKYPLYCNKIFFRWEVYLNRKILGRRSLKEILCWYQSSINRCPLNVLTVLCRMAHILLGPLSDIKTTLAL